MNSQEISAKDFNNAAPELNDEQKKAAFCGENAVVAAGAGSGKTMVLANRYAWLLTEKGFKVDEILTLTFTKKAASQMFRRIYSLLTSIAADDGGIKGARAKEALDNFIHARIQTLDSYSTSLVKQCASRYGISPDFEINNERSYSIASEVSLPFLIKHRSHPAVEKLYSENRPNDIAYNIFAKILNSFCSFDKQNDFTGDVKKQFNIICEEWREQIEKFTQIIGEIDAFYENIPKMCPDLLPAAEKYRHTSSVILSADVIRNFFNELLTEAERETPQRNQRGKSIIEKAESHPVQNQLKELLYFISELNEVKINKGTPQKNPVKENLKLIRLLYGPLSSLIVYCMQAGLILSFMSLLNELKDTFLKTKRTEGVLTFNDIAVLSRTILLNEKDIRQSEKEAFKAVMIDEFQDNNELQKDILFLLAEKITLSGDDVPSAENLCSDKLFFVGDEKQSVYLFRGADVSVFRKLKEEIKSANLPLRINYRSVSALIGAFNAIFGGSKFDPMGKEPLYENASVFAEQSETLPLYEASYMPLEANHEGSGNLTVCILNKKDEEKNVSEDDAALNPVENEARFAAEKIKQLLNEKKGEKKYHPKDIAVLFRTHASQHIFEKHLRLLGIPYTSEDINDLFYSGVVNDIMSVLRLAAHPLDCASYAEMLRSPFAGLSLAGTAVCISVFNEEKNKTPFNKSALPFLDEEDQKKYTHGQKIYASICEKAASESISSLVSELWYKEGYRYETEWHPNTSVYREYFDYLYHLAVKADNENQGLALFTEDILRLRDSSERLKDIVIPLDRPGAVHLMTIHKSKGLEFPVVFICCCGKYSRRNQNQKVYDSGESGIVFSPPLPNSCYNIQDVKKNFFWEKVKTEEKRKKTAELRRLLYVAMTRAEEKLFLTGVLDIDNAETNDLSLKIKNYSEKKYEEKAKKNEIYIEGDSIINNDTFFGLLLPAISSHIPPDGLKTGAGFFNIEAIPVYTEEYLKNYELKEKSIKNNQEGLNEYLEKYSAYYENADIIETPALPGNHITPVSLKKSEDEKYADFTINKEFSGGKSDDIFIKVDSILSGHAQETSRRGAENSGENSGKFNSAQFGTIAHNCVEALFSGKEVIIPSNISGLLKPSVLTALTEAGNEIAERFALSPLGKTAQLSNLRENEFPFLSIIKNSELKEIYINGVIDLLFEDNDCFHVVDFKTDSREMPQEHIAQMACYYNAVCGIFALPSKKQCRIWLYYLRTGHAFEMTEKAKVFNIEKRAFNS